MPSSTIFGSIMMSLTSSGVDRYRREMIRLFMQTDLPEPVVPAISKCGSLLISQIIRLPPISLPTAKATFDLFLLNSGESMTSRAKTVETTRFGTSMPTTETFSGMAAMRTPEAPSASAISSARFVTLDNLTPRSSSSSYRVTDGPRVTLMICASMPKDCSVSLRRSAFCRISSVPSCVCPLPAFRSSTGGN